MGKARKISPKNLPSKLKEIRESLGISMESMAKALMNYLPSLGYDNVSLYSSYIADYESGKREPPLPVLLAYSEIGKISIGQLIDDRIKIKL